MLRALAQQALGDIPAALAALERALALAEPEGYVRVFADEGPPMTALLRAAAKAGIRRDYARRLLAAVRGPEDDGPVEQALVDPLSERELDVLRLLGTELNGPARRRPWLRRRPRS
jgi:LuxR family maltose regulon positive regulatory protein